MKNRERERNRSPVTMAVRPDPSIPCVTSSAVEEAENPDGPVLLNNHIPSLLSDTRRRKIV